MKTCCENGNFGESHNCAKSSAEAAPPKHPLEISISIGAEDMDYAEYALKEIILSLKKGDTAINAGGGGGGFTMRLQKRDVTKEQYREELDQWMKRN